MFLRFIYFFIFILSSNAQAYIDPGFLSSIAMYVFMIFNFLVLFLFVYPKEIIKKLYNKFFKKKKNDIKKN
jgi:hypothetical protein